MTAKEFIYSRSQELAEAIDNGYDLRLSEPEILYWMEKYAEYKAKKLPIHNVSKSLRDKEQFVELAKMIEIHIQKSIDYKASIGTGYFTERFNEVYKKYLESNVC